MRSLLVIVLMALAITLVSCDAANSQGTPDLSQRVDEAVKATTVARQIEEAASATIEARGPTPKPAPPIPTSWTTHSFSTRAGSVCFPPEFNEIDEEADMFGALNSSEEGLVIIWKQPPLPSNDFPTQIDWLQARFEELIPADPEYETRNIDEEGRLDAPRSPAFIAVTNESRLASASLTTVIFALASDLEDAPIVALVRHPEMRLSKSALDDEIDIVSQIASCYKTDS